MTAELANPSCVVMKLGGSVLRRAADYDRCATRLSELISADDRTRLVVVVSAQFGHTDRLLRYATRVGGELDDSATTLLLATGELRSVALLTLRLKRLGIAAAGVGPQQTGIDVVEDIAEGSQIRVNPSPIMSLLAANSIVVVPGFIGTAAGAAWVTLGRGGSDLTAVVLAAALRAKRCELVKDVPGYFSADPNSDASAVHIPWISYGDALGMAAAGCDLVQANALRLAEAHRLPLCIRALHTRERWTTVDAGADESRAVRQGCDALIEV